MARAFGLFLLFVPSPAWAQGEWVPWQTHARLNDNRGADAWENHGGRMRGVVNDAIAVYFRDAALAAAFAARWCAPAGPGVSEGFLRIRDDAPAPRIAARPHKTP
jgi:hypothetical protein